MKTIWVVVADEAIARILEKPQEGGDLVPVEELTDPQAHSKASDLRREPYGRRASGGSADAIGGANVTSSAGDAELHVEAQQFAARVAQRLKQLHQQKRFDEIRIVAAPRFLGYLRKQLDGELANVVTGSLDKDLIHLSNAEITGRLFQPHDGIA
jgi:protein required for attachment to host cells